MKRCKVCKDWLKIPHKTTEGVTIGECHSEKLKDYYHNTLRDGICTGACGFKVSVMTGENFGCINCIEK